MEWTLIKISQRIIKTNVHKILVIIYTGYSKHRSVLEDSTISIGKKEMVSTVIARS